MAGWFPRPPLWGVMAALALLAPGAAAGGSRYDIDQRYGSIGFSVRELGLFSEQGRFQRFAGQLAIDPARPEATKIDVHIDVGSVTMPSEQAVQMLLSPAYFDARTYPGINFRSTSVVATGPDRYRILGVMEIRGISHPQALEASLDAAKDDPQSGLRTEYFTVTGKLHRSDFGMTANQNFVGDVVHLMIHIHLILPALQHAG